MPQVAVGVGTLAGSTIMLLTITWAGSLLCARCDLNSQVQAMHSQVKPACTALSNIDT